jgi:aspartate/methionine/tyrosine aminotransferase
MDLHEHHAQQHRSRLMPATLAMTERFTSLKPSATVEMTERVRVARDAGKNVIGLSSGDPNLPTDPRIIESAARALRDGATHYSAAAGELALREAIVRRERGRSGVAYEAEDILVTPGGKFAMLTALMGIVGPGDEVLIPQPSWVSYGPCVRLCGGVVVPVPMLDTIDMDVFERALTPATRAVIVNSPCNPTGRVLGEAEIASLVDVARSNNLWIIFDQVYADLVYGNGMAYPQALADGYERTLVVDSFSKSFGMTGWRLGYLALPPQLGRSVVKFIQHSIYCVPQFIQIAGITALELADELLPLYRDRFSARLDRASDALSDVPGVTCSRPDAGFFLFPKVAGDEVAIARQWLDEIGVAVLPGSAFGEAGAGHLRISLSCEDGVLTEALARIARVGIRNA